MDTLREAHHAQLFRLLAQDLAGALTVERLADHLSKLADIMVEATLREVWQAMPKRHREVPRFAVIAYGKLGGKELGYASDLDLIFLYEDEPSGCTDALHTSGTTFHYLDDQSDFRRHIVRYRHCLATGRCQRSDGIEFRFVRALPE